MIATMATEAPPRSLTQRLDALDEANRIRSYRAKLKRDVKAGRTQVEELLLNPPEDLLTMKVFELLMCTPKRGRVKVNKIMTVCRLSPSKTVGGMSERQRNEIVDRMRQ